MMTSKKLKSLAWLLSGLLVSCDQAVGPGKAAQGDAADTAPPIRYVETAKGKRGGTLNVVTPRELTTIDFQRTGGPRNGWYARLLLDSLVYLDEQGEVQPWLAKSWTISPDGKTYTFKLRDDVSFSDGAKFNAEAVRVNLDRIRDPATKAAVTTNYIDAYVGGTVIDEYTFQANLSRPHSPFLKVLALSIFGLYSPKQILEAPETLAQRPIGSGPFVLEKFVPQEGLSYVRREDYHWAPPYINHEGPAYVDRIEVKVVPEVIVYSSALQAGQFDITVDAQAQLAASLRGHPSFSFAGRVLRGNPSQGPVFNTQVEPFNDVRLRRAFALAVDREGIVLIKGFRALNIKSDFLSTNTEFYDPSYTDLLKYHPDEANRLLDEAGWKERDADEIRVKDGKRLSVEVLVSSTTPNADVLPMIQSDIKKVGIELKLVQVPPLDLAARRANGTYQLLASTGLHTNTPDALYVYFHSSQVPSEEKISSNYSRLSDPELDGYLEAARATPDPALQKEFYSKAQRRIIELVPAVPLHENTVFEAYNINTVKGLIHDTSHDLPLLISAWLDR